MRWTRPLIPPSIEFMYEQDRHSIHLDIQTQFGATAAAYSISAGHGDASALARLVALSKPRSIDAVLDIATGAGHTAMAFAPHVARVTAYDLTEAMLRETARNAAQRGLQNITVQRGPAEELPFPDALFDLVMVRLASHHFADNPRAIREMARVTRPGGRVVIVDNYAPEDEALDGQLQHVEKLRDSSHVRSCKLSVWRRDLQSASLKILHETTDRYSESERGMNFDDWVQRSKTPDDRVAQLRKIFTHPVAAFRELLNITQDGQEIWFTLPQVTLVAER